MTARYLVEGVNGVNRLATKGEKILLTTDKTRRGFAHNLDRYPQATLSRCYTMEQPFNYNQIVAELNSFYYKYDKYSSTGFTITITDTD